MPSSMRVAVSINQLSKTYPVPLARFKQFLRRRVKPPIEALRDVSFDVREGEIFGLIGRNGAGKTTLAKIVATLVQPTSGTVTVHGFDSVKDDEKVRAQVGLATAEERSFYWRLTVEQNLMFFSRLYGLSDKAARRCIKELLEQLELEELSKRRFGELSTGNKQRMALARALISNPPVLLLDEPTRSLDPLAAARLRSLIKNLSTRETPVSILLTSHNLDEVEELCARVTIISRGQIRAVDTPKNLRRANMPSERLHITARGIDTKRAAQIFDGRFEALEMKEEDSALNISFTRHANDDSLDAAVRSLQENGATILSFDSERATLLDVLESYEAEEKKESD